MPVGQLSHLAGMVFALGSGCRIFATSLMSRSLVPVVLAAVASPCNSIAIQSSFTDHIAASTQVACLVGAHSQIAYANNAKEEAASGRT